MISSSFFFDLHTQKYLSCMNTSLIRLYSLSTSNCHLYYEACFPYRLLIIAYLQTDLSNVSIVKIFFCYRVRCYFSVNLPVYSPQR